MFDTENLIIVCYPQLAGGKFLINCLGLSDDSVFQSAQLVDKQLSGMFTPQDKINLLLERIEATTIWRDLGLGCYQLFGVQNHEYALGYGSIKEEHFNPVVKELVCANKKFFKVAHSFNFLKSYLTVWKNPKVIVFKNYKEFIFDRVIDPDWSRLRISECQLKAPRSRQELIELNLDIKIPDLFASKYFYFLDFLEIHDNLVDAYVKSNQDCIVWDVNLYDNPQQMIIEIEKLYDKLNLSNFNPTAIQDYYVRWQSKINQIKQL